MTVNTKGDEPAKTKIKPSFTVPQKVQARMSALAAARGLYHGEGDAGVDATLAAAAKFEEYILKGLKGVGK